MRHSQLLGPPRQTPQPRQAPPETRLGCIDGYLFPGAVHAALLGMLDAQPGVRSLLLETDSPCGDPSRASRWVASPIFSNTRADASLHALLIMPPISLTRERAASYHQHSAKRFLLSAAEWADGFGGPDASEIGRFSGSIAQNPDLEPIQAMLQRHTLRSSVLPDIYSRQARVDKVFDALAALHFAVKRAAVRLRDTPDAFSGDAWEAMRGSPDS